MKLHSERYDLGTINPGFEFGAEGNKKDIENEGKGESKAEQAPARDNWDSPIEFLLSCVAMSVGLGNVWRFPFTAYSNGGGAFLIPYLFVLMFVGKPLYYMELILGQFSSRGSVKVWEMVPAAKGIGYGQAVAAWCVTTYYVSLMALTCFYMLSSFYAVLPWSACPPNVTECIDSSTNVSAIAINSSSISAAEMFFENEVLKKYPFGLDDGIGAPEWRLSLCLLFSWLFIFLTLVKGVKSSGKVAYFTALFPYVVLIILLIRGVTLPGAWKGIKYFITPQWDMLLKPSVWYAAVSQCFFSLSIGFGTIIMYSSYNKFSQNIYRDATILSFTDTFTSLLAGCTIFAILGHLAELMGVDDVGLVIKGGGSAMAFVSYPDVLARFQWVPQLFSVLFFLMLFTLGIGSATALTGSITTIIQDAFPYFKKVSVTSGVCICGFGVGLFYITPQGSYILDLVDHYGGNFIAYILAFLEVVAVNWIYGYGNFTRDIEFMLKRKTGIYWGFCWVGLIPILLSVIFIYVLIEEKALTSGSYVFGPGANGFGILITVVAVGFVPFFFGLTFYKNLKITSSFSEALKRSFRPSSSFGPKDPILRKEYKDSLDDSVAVKLNGVDNLATDINTPSVHPYPDISTIDNGRI